MIEQLFPLISAGASTAQVVLMVVVLHHHRRVSRIERKIWPDVFGDE